MSSFSAVARKGLISLLLSSTLVLAGCSGLRPVYGDYGVANARMEMTYGKPSNRLEQVIYQEFVLRFGRTADARAPRLVVTARASDRELTSTSVVKPVTQKQVTVTASATLTAPDGKVVFSGSRTATAQYTAGPQVLAETEAEIEASERAAKEAAEGLRLAILGALAAPATGR